MEEMKQNLIKRALKTYKKIYPCGTRSSLKDCFTFYDGQILFWFDTEDRSTHMITEHSVSE